MRRTITAVYDTYADAERAEERLRDIGVSSSDIRIVRQGDTTGKQHKSLWESIKELFVSEEDRYTYAEGLRRGGCLLAVEADDANVNEVVDILESSNAVDLDARTAEWKQEGWSETTGYEGEPTSAASRTSGASQRSDEQSIPVVEERLRVGKREVNRGGVRVRSYVVEEPVHEDVQLHEERVEVERRPASQSTQAAPDEMLQERTIEVTEKAEEAVVAKEAVVKEEVVVKKFAGERTKGVDETLRRTEVDVEDTRAPDETTPTRTGASTSARKDKDDKGTKRP